MNISLLIIFFAVYSFAGWLIELIYRSAAGRRLINPGFLFGPFVPVYGTGALLILMIYSHISFLNTGLQFIVYTIILTMIEFATGELFEVIFGLKLWDYTDTRFHIKGKVSLTFSAAWGILAMTLTHLAHPVVSYYTGMIPIEYSTAASILFTAYIVTDTTASVVSLNRFRRGLVYLYEKYSTLSSHETEKIIASFNRLLKAFPHLNRLLDFNIAENLRERISDIKFRLAEAVESVVNERKPAEDEYLTIVSDILEDPEFLKLKGFFHHNSSIYDHARIVSYTAYRISKFLNLDYKSAARGGLLHDFFLYDWRNHDLPELAREKFHGLEHPKIALENSLKRFELNDIERDIILKHMWPLTIVPPKYRESFVVTFSDKYVSSREFAEEFTKRGMKRLNDIKKSGKALKELE